MDDFQKWQKFKVSSKFRKRSNKNKMLLLQSCSDSNSSNANFPENKIKEGVENVGKPTYLSTNDSEERQIIFEENEVFDNWMLELDTPDESNLDKEEDKIKIEINLRDDLRKWALDYNISHQAIGCLLKTLKKNLHIDLPVDPRTLLKTPPTVTFKDIGNGFYWHHGLEVCLKQYFSSIDRSISISLNINIDGLPTFKSSQSQFWPILFNIHEFKNFKPMVIGIYSGQGKPSNLNDYLGQFIDECREVLANGVLIENHKISVRIRCFICDSPARAYIKGVCYFNGKHGCLKCTVVGEYIKNCTVFLRTHCPKRTNTDFRQKKYGLHHKELSPLEKLPIDMVDDFPIGDSLHLIDLGIVKKLLSGWTFGYFKGTQMRFSARDIELITTKLKNIKLPSEMHRSVRGLDSLVHWKGTEYRSFIYYLAIVVLKDHLHYYGYEHLLSFFCAITICSVDGYKHFLPLARTLLEYFIEKYIELYKEHSITSNVHNLCHLVDEVEKFGILNTFHAYPFENQLYVLKNLLRTGTHPLAQAAKRIMEKNHVRDFGCGKLYYKTFYIDEPNNVIYVGAMDRVFRLNLQNISQSLCDNQKDVIILEPTGSDILNCVSKGKRELFECRNHIRVIQPMDQGRKLYICGTNAHNPKDYAIYANLTHLPRSEYVPGISLGIGKCPYDPLDNSTAVWVEHGNPDNLPGLYSGTNAEFTKADSVIFRSDLYNYTTSRKEHNFKRTLKYDSKWLDKPNFVGSFDIGEYVYFFFRERAVEYINCGKAIYSRIARVCKNDKGGKYNNIGQNWATYLKARVNCSISSEFPFYFNEIQSVYKMPNDNTKFYATFTTNTHGIVGSAICSYDIRDINAAFDGKFKEQFTSNSAWLPVLNSKVPEPRPGVCINDTSSLPDSVLNFIRKHPLMDKAVDHEHAQPVYFKRDVILTKLVVDKIRIDKLNQEYLVYFVGTNTGSIYKIVQYTKYGQRYSSLLDILDISKNEPIREMGISKQTGCLYIATDHSVKQIDLAMCNRRYDSCYRCIKDPYCGWDKDTGACKPYQLGLLQDVGNETSGICDTSVLKKRITASYGQTLHLSCFVRVPEVLRQKNIRWFHHSTEKGRYEINYTPSKYIETSEGGLVVISINEGDGGRYDSYLDGTLLCSYSVNVDAHRCTPPTKKNDYQKIYSHWCNEFEKYKSAMKQWQEKQEQCQAKDKKGVKHINDVIIDDKIV